MEESTIRVINELSLELESELPFVIFKYVKFASVDVSSIKSRPSFSSKFTMFNPLPVITDPRAPSRLL
jgi:hypothetical protein